MGYWLITDNGVEYDCASLHMLDSRRVRFSAFPLRDMVMRLGGDGWRIINGTSVEVWPRNGFEKPDGAN